MKQKRLLFGVMICSVFLTAGITAFAGDGGVLDGCTVTRGGLMAEITGIRVNGDESGSVSTVPETAAEKKPLLAAALSAAVPGAGEFYTGSWIKGTAFLAVEVAAWVGYSHYTDKGNKLRNEFRRYADDHWSREKWVTDHDPNGPSTHGLPETKTQQYYEMIGKYDQFEEGWDDWPDPKGLHPTPRRDLYETMRHDHNHQLINASRCTMGVLLNHMLSALDAAWTVHRHNRSVRAVLGTDVRMALSEPVPVLSLRMAW